MSERNDSEPTWHLLEDRQPFAQSLLWSWQQQYFAARGVDAWRQSEVPHYITSNPTMAHSYAEIVFAFLREQRRLGRGGRQSDEPLYLCELGGGPGRFAFHLLRQLTRLCAMARLPPTSFRYVLTDYAQSNLDFYRAHPRFQTFFDRGVLDIALFDVNQSEQLTLQLSGERITAGRLKRPLVVIANYVFDCIPQELFYIDEQRCRQCLVSLCVDNIDPCTLTRAELLDRLNYYYDYRALDEAPYQEPWLQKLLNEYQQTLTDTHLLFPAAGLRCLQRLHGLSRHGMLLLSADKGEYQLEALRGKPAPLAVSHAGCIPFSVNYHAFKVFCEQSGGLALFPNSRPESLLVCCLLMTQKPADYVETQRAYQRHVADFGPDDFYTIASHARQYIAEMSVEHILAYLRLSHYDSHQFARYLPRLMELAARLSRAQCEAVGDAIAKVWELYFPLGEEPDLAYKLAYLCYEMDDYARALTYFERSLEIYGEHTGTLYNMAACCQLIGQAERAEALLRKVLNYDPDNHEARALLAEYEVR